ncbi:hypothetical protein V6N13_026271 [Hibiscus sabdariffa]|uniref:Uncharacterized protein n=1 Tax=Hibiscus sabdariffa TaxID=183260 RepID=A0ABR2P5V9_9ROSI
MEEEEESISFFTLNVSNRKVAANNIIPAVFTLFSGTPNAFGFSSNNLSIVSAVESATFAFAGGGVVVGLLRGPKSNGIGDRRVFVASGKVFAVGSHGTLHLTVIHPFLGIFVSIFDKGFIPNKRRNPNLRTKFIMSSQDIFGSFLDSS